MSRYRVRERTLGKGKGLCKGTEALGNGGSLGVLGQRGLERDGGDKGERLLGPDNREPNVSSVI